MDRMVIGGIGAMAVIAAGFTIQDLLARPPEAGASKLRFAR
jgi:hypothetical protein